MDITGRPALAKDSFGRLSINTRPTPHLEHVVGQGVPTTVPEEIPRSDGETVPAALEWQFDEGQYDIEGINNDELSEPQKASSKTKPERPPRKNVFRITAGLMMVGLVGVIFYTFTAPSPKSLSASNSNSAVVLGSDMAYIPSIQEEAPPTNYLADYKVDGGFPRYVSIPTLSLTARTIPVGVDGRGQPRLPVRSYDAGWYNVSSKPSEEGVTVLSGTCTTPLTKGVFEELHTVANGDEIIVERGDGIKVKYSVNYVEHVLTADLDMAKLLHPQEGYKTGLSIVTCSGTYDKKTNDMSERLVVYAKQI